MVLWSDVCDVTVDWFGSPVCLRLETSIGDAQSQGPRGRKAGHQCTLRAIGSTTVTTVGHPVARSLDMTPSQWRSAVAARCAGAEAAADRIIQPVAVAVNAARQLSQCHQLFHGTVPAAVTQCGGGVNVCLA